MCDILETVGRTANCIQGTFVSQVYKFGLGSFGAFPFLMTLYVGNG